MNNPGWERLGGKATTVTGAGRGIGEAAVAAGDVPDGKDVEASKAGLDAMIRAIAPGVGPDGACINTIDPGVIDTPMLCAQGKAILPPLAARAALGWIGPPEDVAGVAVWLCTAEARFVTGRCLPVDGGFTIPGPR